MDDGRWTMDDGRWTMDDGRWTMDDGRWTMDDGRWTMDDGRWGSVGRYPYPIVHRPSSIVCRQAIVHRPSSIVAPAVRHMYRTTSLPAGCAHRRAYRRGRGTG